MRSPRSARAVVPRVLGVGPEKPKNGVRRMARIPHEKNDLPELASLNDRHTAPSKPYVVLVKSSPAGNR